jgi:hypothetical protein
MEPDFFVALAAEGNRQLAENLLRAASLGPRVTADLKRRLPVAAAPVGSVFVPLPPVTGEAGGLTCAVRVEKGSRHSACLDEASRSAARTALKDAWGIIDGPGEAPAAGVVLALCDRLPRQVVGSSVYLPALIAAVRCFSDLSLPRSVMATGCFAEPIGSLEAKLGLFHERRERLGLDSLLVASRGPVQGDGVRPCVDRKEAVRQVFGFVPWHPKAKVQRVHVFCGDRHEAPWPDGSYVPVPLARQLVPADLREAVAKVKEAMSNSERVELSIGGPLPLAVKLGIELANHPSEIIFVLRRMRWLSNKK